MANRQSNGRLMIIDIETHNNKCKKPLINLPQLGKWRLTSAEGTLAGTDSRCYLSQKTPFLQLIK